MNKSKINHWCVICGKGYHACNTCNEARGVDLWQKFTDTSNHYRIYQIVRDYHNHIISLKKAHTLIMKCDLDGWEDFRPNVAKTISEILEYEKTKKENRKNVVTLQGM